MADSSPPETDAQRHEAADSTTPVQPQTSLESGSASSQKTSHYVHSRAPRTPSASSQEPSTARSQLSAKARSQDVGNTTPFSASSGFRDPGSATVSPRPPGTAKSSVSGSLPPDEAVVANGSSSDARPDSRQMSSANSGLNSGLHVRELGGANMASQELGNARPASRDLSSSKLYSSTSSHSPEFENANVGTRELGSARASSHPSGFAELASGGSEPLHSAHSSARNSGNMPSARSVRSVSFSAGAGPVAQACGDGLPPPMQLPTLAELAKPSSSFPNTLGDTRTSLLRRVGLSVIDNVDFAVKARDEAYDAEEWLRNFRLKANENVARCQGQWEVVAEKARAEEEQRLISEKVERELEAFRQEMLRKEKEEEERLRHVYIDIMGKMVVPPEVSAQQTHGWRSSDHPSVLATVADLSMTPLGTPQGRDGRPRSTEGINRYVGHADAGYWGGTEEARIQVSSYHHNDQPDRRHKISRAPSVEIPSRRYPSAPPLAPPRRLPPRSESRKTTMETVEVDNVLRLNMARLERLEKMGL